MAHYPPDHKYLESRMHREEREEDRRTHMTHGGLFIEFVGGDQCQTENSVRSGRCFVQMCLGRRSIGKAESDDLFRLSLIEDRDLDEVLDQGGMLVLHQTKVFPCFHLFRLNEQIENRLIVQLEERNPDGITFICQTESNQLGSVER